MNKIFVQSKLFLFERIFLFRLNEHLFPMLVSLTSVPLKAWKKDSIIIEHKQT